jgi:hypothetical protein
MWLRISTHNFAAPGNHAGVGDEINRATHRRRRATGRFGAIVGGATGHGAGEPRSFVDRGRTYGQLHMGFALCEGTLGDKRSNKIDYSFLLKRPFNRGKSL